jgi:1-deoxy-D-xylulose-5-phosphate synthase
MQRNSLYNRVRSAIGDIADSAPGIFGLGSWVRRWEESLKALLTPGVLFEELGFRYFGIIDGHDIGAMIDTFAAVRGMSGPRLVHVRTEKGKGFPAGATNIEKWHALPPGHDPATGQLLKASTSLGYTKVFGKGLAELGAENADVVAVTAAMPSGTGTDAFAKAHPKRFFDVGIAEAHAVTFAAGVATRGVRPVVAIYSTFLQRAYDSIIHDVAIQSLPVVFCLDRAGLVGEDGETHMGLYDIAYLLTVPNMTVTAPKDGREMLGLLRAGVKHTRGPFSIRYPRDAAPDTVPAIGEIEAVPYGTWEVLRQGRELAILATGTTVLPAMAAAESLAADGSGMNITVVNCRFLKPYDEVTLAAVLAEHTHILIVEEGTVTNGFGAMMSSVIERHAPNVRVLAHGVPDRVIPAAPRVRQLAQAGLDAAGIAARVRALRELESEAMAG